MYSKGYVYTDDLWPKLSILTNRADKYFIINRLFTKELTELFKHLDVYFNYSVTFVVNYGSGISSIRSTLICDVHIIYVIYYTFEWLFQTISDSMVGIILLESIQNPRQIDRLKKVSRYHSDIPRYIWQ